MSAFVKAIVTSPLKLVTALTWSPRKDPLDSDSDFNTSWNPPKKVRRKERKYELENYKTSSITQQLLIENDSDECQSCTDDQADPQSSIDVAVPTVCV